MENFKWRNSEPYQVGHNKRLVILPVVIISGAYCIYNVNPVMNFYINKKMLRTNFILICIIQVRLKFFCCVLQYKFLLC